MKRLMMKWEPLGQHWTMRKQHGILRNLSSVVSNHSSPSHQQRGVGGQEIDDRRNTSRWSQPESQLPAKPPYSKIGFTIYTIISWRGRWIKADFLHFRQYTHLPKLFLTPSLWHILQSPHSDPIASDWKEYFKLCENFILQLFNFVYNKPKYNYTVPHLNSIHKVLSFFMHTDEFRGSGKELKLWLQNQQREYIFCIEPLKKQVFGNLKSKFSLNLKNKISADSFDPC